MDFFRSLLETELGCLFYTFLLSMAPIVELRGAIPLGIALLGADSLWKIYLVSVVGNMVPVPFIIIYIRKLFHWMRARSPQLDRLVGKLEATAHLKGRLVTKYRVLGLCILVAIPLPGTGAWTGALVAAFLDMRLRDALPTIFLGVLIAGVAVSFIATGLFAAFG